GLAFDIQTPGPIEMAVGAVIDYRIKLGPAPMKWRTVIEEHEPGARFVDAQHKGPYKVWWHEHRFEADGDQAVLSDNVYYKPPFGLLGRIAHVLFIKPMLKRIFSYRQFAMRIRFGVDSKGAESGEEGGEAYAA
ncbi:MAG: SRPBCC family protein, partial [Myxococcales bacterium]|nr:SRPBCC family protein [Myxococcales bacterium]